MTITAPLIVQSFANSGDLAVPPQTDPSGFVNWNQGYTPFYEIQLGVGNPQAKAVERPVQNALFNIVTSNISAWQQLGFSPWQSAMPGGYNQNAQVMRLNGSAVWTPYRSLVGSNVSDPLTTPAQWEYVQYSHEMTANIPMPSGGTTGATGEVVTVATNFNTFTTGTWQFQTDAIAAGSANAPAPTGGSTTAGLLESLAWINGATTYTTQRYLDRNGNLFFRGATNGTWTGWQSGAYTPPYSIDTSSTVNLVSATFSVPSAVLADNQQFWVKVANTNTGAATFTPNPAIITVPLAIIGTAHLALQGGELIAGGRALLIYKADTTNFVLVECTGGALQTATATKSSQAVNYGQLQALAYQYNVPTWAGYGPAPAAASSIGDRLAMQFLKAINQSAFFSIPWIGSSQYTLPLKLLITYTGPTSGGNFYLQIQYQVIAAGGSMLASYTTTVDTAPGPSSANAEAQYKTATAVIPAASLVANATINIVFTRLSTNALDTNTGTLLVTDIATEQ